MARELFARWQDPTFEQYTKLFQKAVQQKNKIDFSKPLHITMRGKKHVTLHHPIFINVKDRIKQLETLLAKNTYTMALHHTESVSKPSAKQSMDTLSEINTLHMYMEMIKSSYKKQCNDLEDARQSLNVTRKKGSPSQYIEAYKKLINDHKDYVPFQSDTVVYIHQQPQITESQVSPIQKQVTKSPPAKKSKASKKENVEHQIERVKHRVLPNMSPFKMFANTFQSEEECASMKRSAPYFVTRAQLVEMIKSKAALRVKFDKLHKMSKDDICKKLFDEANPK